MRKIRWAVILIPFVFPFLISGQSNTAPLLTVKDAKDVKPIILTKLDVEVKIVGFIAETKMTMTFYNSNNRELEGELNFPLPQGSTVSGYALDIKGVLVDGVAVEKKKARVVFEKIVRQGIDPSLVEMVKGNVFKTRIYPILAKKSRMVSLRYLSELIFRDKKAYFHLPLDLNEKVKDFSIKIEVIKPGVMPKIEKSSFENFQFLHWRESYLAEKKLKNILLDQELIIGLPIVAKKHVYIEKGFDGEYYFSIYDFNPAYKRIGPKEKKAPKHITILWDASGSMGKDNHKKELELIESIFNKYNKRKISVDLVFFRNTKSKKKSFVIKSGNSDEIIKEIKNVYYDGGTQMGVLSPEKEEKVPNFYLLFTDGISNFGKEEPSGFKAPFYVFSNASYADHSFLQHLAMQTGGIYFNLRRMDKKGILNRINRPAFRFISAAANEIEVSETYPTISQPISGCFFLTGKLLKNPPAGGPYIRNSHCATFKRPVQTRIKKMEIPIRLNYGINGKVIKSHSFQLKLDKAIKGNLIRTFWAQKKIEDLGIFAKKNKEELIKTGKKFGLVTPYTSLIVLESLNQYLEHEIKPPESLPEMCEKYEKIMSERKKEEKKYQEYRVENILRLWKKRVEWWNKTFRFPVKEKKQTQESARRRSQPGQRVQETPERQRQVNQPEQIAEEILNRPEYITGQSGNISIMGTIAIDDGSNIPGVTIEAIGSRITGIQATVSNENGGYRFIGLPTGSYDLTFRLEGFKTKRIRNVPVVPEKTCKLDIILELGKIQEQIVVSARAPVIDVRKSASSISIVKEDFNDINITSYIDGVDTVVESGVSISIKPWNAKTPYIKKLSSAKPKDLFSVFLQQKKIYGNSPGFYLDCSDFFFERKEKEIGLQILSNISEMKIEEASLLRILAHRLSQLNFLDLSEAIFEKVLELRPEEPQSYRDLALILARQKKYQRAVELLYHIVMNEWDSRFNEIEIIALMELNNILFKAKREKESININELKIDPRFVQRLHLDIRIVLTWDADNTDIDLWVFEPTEEKAYYSNNLTKIGGLVSDDFTGGYGPEEYVLKKAFPGKYIIKANYFGSGAPVILGPVTLQAEIFTNYGRNNEKRKSITLRLKEEEEVITVGEIEF